ncbi:Exopolyphosphatase [Savitreella phatthalungensis]
MHLARQRLASFSPATVLVVGNESADLDSCVSSIAFAVLRDIAQTASAGEVRHIPIVNVDRSDLHLRKELSVLLPVVGLSMDDLICRDELPREAETERTNWALVDHNHFRVRNVSADNAEVVAVVDHHVDEGLYLSAEPRLISTAGSCTSLVLDHFKRLLQPSTVPAVLSEIAMIAQATVGRLQKAQHKMLTLQCRSASIPVTSERKPTALIWVASTCAGALVRKPWHLTTAVLSSTAICSRRSAIAPVSTAMACTVATTRSGNWEKPEHGVSAVWSRVWTTWSVGKIGSAACDDWRT